MQQRSILPRNSALVKSYKLNKVISEINPIDSSVSEDTLKQELECNIVAENWGNVVKILDICLNKKINIDNSKMMLLLQTFASIGYKDGLNVLRSLYKIMKYDTYLAQGEFLLYIAKCNWINSNVKECLKALRECLDKYPALKNDCKILLKNIILEAIFCRSKAELLNIIEFVQIFTRENKDYYPISILWNYLFLSEWFSDQQLAKNLIDTNEELRLCIILMCPALTRYLIKTNRISDVYRLLELLLKHNMMESYSHVNQMLFDFYCFKRNRSACAEIIKSSTVLNISLREEQYNQFISWSISGDPFKFLKKIQIEKIYSKF
ncbi:hypothetical protein PGB90_000409 [Kerria lacca]